MDYSFANGGQKIDEVDALKLKEKLSKSKLGQEVIDYIENEVKLNNYILTQNDVGRMADGYVKDLSGYINIANKENVRILKGKSLI